jgi:alkanesulfonate monooxygenase SsuD/methylene tetrahydromethanopterin reductase-like flavin-dependent oxidoreductase (luciferase family)
MVRRTEAGQSSLHREAFQHALVQAGGGIPEFVQAIRAIWKSWETGEKLAFRREFYTHTLMTPFFSPGRNPHGTPPIFLAGVGPRMVEAVGEVADGFLVHPLHTPAYLRAETLPSAGTWPGQGRSPARELRVLLPDHHHHWQ